MPAAVSVRSSHLIRMSHPGCTNHPLALRCCFFMSFIPRRRLVLASARPAGVHTQWSSSQMPWDAEEGAFADDSQICTSSQNACFTQENALTAQQQADRGLQLDHQAVYGADTATEQASDGLHFTTSCDHASELQQHFSHAAALDQFILPREEYSDLYNFLTKGSGHVQEVSAKERALFKLSDLRQVSNLDGPLLYLGLDVMQLLFAGYETAWCDSRWQN